MKPYKIIIIYLVFFLHFSAYAQASNTKEITARVLGIGNQNTILVERTDKLGTKINIQLRGLQLAHHNGQCDFERELAEETKTRILDLVGGKHVTLRNATPSPDEHTAEADVFNHESINIGQYLLYEAVLAHPTDTGTRADWCGREGE